MQTQHCSLPGACDTRKHHPVVCLGLVTHANKHHYNFKLDFSVIFHSASYEMGGGHKAAGA
jgi:hypothetical protein